MNSVEENLKEFDKVFKELKKSIEDYKSSCPIFRGESKEESQCQEARKYLFGIGKGIATFSKHRGFWHSIYGLFIFAFISLIIIYLTKASFFYSLALPLGYFMHLAADSLNVSGIRWFWKSKKLHLKWKIKTGTISEQLFFILLIFVTTYLLIGNQGIKEITSFASKIKP